MAARHEGAGKAERHAAAALDLLGLLSTADGKRVSRERARATLHVDDEGLDRMIAMVGELSNPESGAHAAIAREGDDLVLVGQNDLLHGRRLTVGEGLVLSQALRALHLDAGVRDRIGRVLLPLAPLDAAPDPSEDGAFMDATPFGRAYLELDEALRYGIRCCLSYRSSGEEAARERLVDPLALDTVDGMPYLTGWDVELDHERRYRLDRVDGVSFTDDSVVRHDWRPRSLAESLRGAGETARLRFEREGDARWLAWAGLGEIVPTADGGAEATVAYASEAWLFDQVLASGGGIRIVEPVGLADRLRAYADALLVPKARA